LVAYKEISVKNKISVTVEQSLLEFLDSLPGESRSGKIERALLKLKKVMEERELRAQLGSCREDDAERVEREIWESTVAEAMWNE
jgi:cell fate regulator YaaT (PSP1 superfamily)